MDDRTGKIYDRIPGETQEQFANRIGVPASHLRPMARRPNPQCPKCGGKGYKRKPGQKPRAKFKFYEPCPCTQ